ncbi:MAG TPA: AAA family ATPase [bacterium]|jgi:predicted ATPase
MEGKRFIRRIKVQNLLSFDEEGIDLELQPLNVLIGPNGSGKSNLIDVVSILRSLRDDFTEPFLMSGAIEWMSKGVTSGDQQATQNVPIITVNFPWTGEQASIQYTLSFVIANYRAEIMNEVLLLLRDHQPEERLFVRLQKAAQVKRRLPERSAEEYLFIYDQDPDPQKSLFDRTRDELFHPEAARIGNSLAEIRLYTDWSSGRHAANRQPQSADLRGDFLQENARNLASVLNSLFLDSELGERVTEHLRGLYPRITSLHISPSGSAIQLYVKEERLNEAVPATRMSDGFLRFLSLLTVLLHPTPPPLVCIEEPELGLHPDMIHKIAELLKDAATRTQLIVTTHSDLLISALSDIPEAIVVCEHDGRGTRMQRLEPEKMKDWLERYSLGEVWLKGAIGGTRW